MKYGKIELDGSINGESLLTEEQFRELFKNVSLPMGVTDEVVRPLGYAALEAPKKPDEPMTYDKTVAYKVIKNQDGSYTRQVEYVQLSEAQAEARKARKWAEVIEERYKRLADTDFSQVSDSRSSRLYVSYRQSLRDITSVFDDPFLVEFPETPENDILLSMEQSVQNFITIKVKELGYDDENSIAKYLVAGNPFEPECTTISLWIGNVWTTAVGILTDVSNGTREVPEDIISELPELV